MGTKKTKKNGGVLSLETFQKLAKLGDEFALAGAEFIPKKERVAFLNLKLAQALKENNWQKAKEVVHKLGRQLTTREMEKMIASGKLAGMIKELPQPSQLRWYKLYLKRSLKEGNERLAKDLVQKLGRELTKSELKILVASGSKSDEVVAQATGVSSEKVKEARLKAELAKQIKDGYSFVDCQNTAKALGRELTKLELETLLKGSMQRGHLEQVKEIRTAQKKLFTVKDMTEVLKAQKQWGLNQHNVDSVIKTIDLFLEPRRTRELNTLMEEVLDAGETNAARKVQEALGRPFSSAELEKMYNRYPGTKDLAEQLLRSLGHKGFLPQDSRGGGWC